MPGRADNSVEDRTDWLRVNAFSDEEIERIAAEDDENPATSEGDWSAAFTSLPPQKTPASLDADVVDWFKAQAGRNYYSRLGF